MEKKYDKSLVNRIVELRKGLGPQPLAALWNIDPSLRGDPDENRIRRVLSKKVFPGDAPFVLRLEKAKAKLLKARK